MAEAELFKKIGGKGRIEFLSNGTDLEVRRLPLEHIPFHAGGANRVRRPNAPTVVFVGTMDYYPNIDAVRFFVDEIFPLVRQKFSRASFEIIGRRPSKSVQRLNKIDGVRVVGEVSDVRSRLVCADLSVAPMRIARGVQNKVLEAMAVGVPVVATPLAIEGIDVRDGEDVLVGSSREEFAAQVTRVLTDSELRRTLTKKAWNKMNQSYNWGSIGAKLEQLLFTAPSFKSIEPAKAEISVGQR
jgi:glycosyltransferase involved in cell wall biosynthesis